ncbi:MAG: hypothetical protein ACOCWQ_02015 [Nanoarchaeota archaeon]
MANGTAANQVVIPSELEFILKFSDSHKIQRIVGDDNLLHIPQVTRALPKEHPLYDIALAPGFVLSSVAVYESLRLAAQDQQSQGNDPSEIWLKGVNVKTNTAALFYGTGVRDKDDPRTHLLSLESGLQPKEQEYEVFHNLWVVVDDSTQYNTFQNRTEDNEVMGSETRVQVGLAKASLPSEVRNIDLPVKQLGHYRTGTSEGSDIVLAHYSVSRPRVRIDAGEDFGRYFSAVQHIAGKAGTSEQDHAVQRAVADAMRPWFYFGCMGRLYSACVADPTQAGHPGQQYFEKIRGQIGFQDVPVEQLHANLPGSFLRRYPEQEYVNLLSDLGVRMRDGHVVVPTDKIPAYGSFTFSAMDRCCYNPAEEVFLEMTVDGNKQTYSAFGERNDEQGALVQRPIGQYDVPLIMLPIKRRFAPRMHEVQKEYSPPKDL